MLHIFGDRSSRTISRRFRPALLGIPGFDGTLASCDAALLRVSPQPPAPILAGFREVEIAVESGLLKRTSYSTTISNGVACKKNQNRVCWTISRSTIGPKPFA